MRINIYAEEMTDRLEIITKTVDGHDFTALRFYLELPVTVGGEHGRHRAKGQPVYPPVNGKPAQVSGPFIHRPGDDDSSAVTFWGKQDLRVVLRKALTMLDDHYTGTPPPAEPDLAQLVHKMFEIADRSAKPDGTWEHVEEYRDIQNQVRMRVGAGVAP